MIPDDCKRKECIHYYEERENNWRECKHPEYDMEENQCRGWLSVDDAKYAHKENEIEDAKDIIRGRL